MNMLNDINVLKLYKKEKISDATLSRYLTDIFKSNHGSEIVVKVVKDNSTIPASIAHLIQTVPCRKNERLISKIFIDHKLLINLDENDTMDILLNEVKNNSIYIKMFNRFLQKNIGMRIDPVEALVLLIDIYLVAYDQLTSKIKSKIEPLGINSNTISKIIDIKNKLTSNEISYLQAKDCLYGNGLVPMWLIDCAEKIAISSGSPKYIYDIEYDVDIDTLKQNIIKVNQEFSSTGNVQTNVSDIDGSKFKYVEKHD